MVCNHKSLNTTLFGSATIIRYVEYTSLIARIKLVTLNSESYNLDILKEFFTIAYTIVILEYLLLLESIVSSDVNYIGHI